nr:MAG: RNA dependent RNA polymerase [Leviviridae sp.]
MLDGDIALLTKIWWALANNQRYHGYLGDLTSSQVQASVDRMGLSFFTHALPSVGKALDGHFAGQPVGELGTSVLDFPFRRALLGDPVAVDCVRQLAYLFYKLEVPYSDDLVAEFLDAFVKTDAELDDAMDPMFSDHMAGMREVVGLALKGANPYNIRPSHGSGATACRTKNHSKYRTVRYFPCIDQVYAYSDYFYLNVDHLADAMSTSELVATNSDTPVKTFTHRRYVESLPYFTEEGFWLVTRTMEQVEVPAGEETVEGLSDGVPRARIVLVPKDSRGPRVISCEPAEHMYIQQGIMGVMYAHLETRSVTRGFVNFTDQTVNRELAHLASMSDKLATLDLKDASDRVSLRLVRRIFPDEWVECLMACRTPATELPDGRVVELRKFAPMGSSVCFPVEALTFWASAVATQIRLGFKPEAYVYGDDIIVPSETAHEVIRDLEGIGLRVNAGKSYVTGPFRESCGGDYYLGSDVTPVRLKKWFGSSVLELVRASDFVNSLVTKFGLRGTILDILDYVQEYCRYVFPKTELPVPCTIRSQSRASNDTRFKRRWNKGLQRYEYLILTPQCNAKEHHPADWWELLRKQLTREDRKPAEWDEVGLLLWTISKPVPPGYYVDPRAIHGAWKWTWLGS